MIKYKVNGKEKEAVLKRRFDKNVMSEKTERVITERHE
jgi:hypothetical protein